MSRIKRFRIFSGPNGSGKSTLIHQIARQYDLGIIINADVIESSLAHKKYFEITKFFRNGISQKEWKGYLNTIQNDERFVNNGFPSVRFTKRFLVSEGTINSYHAALIAEFFRLKLLHNNSTFSFETVMSHSSKVDFIKSAKEKGFKSYLYFLCTQDPQINIQRVKNRVIKGGHDVSQDKIEQRYYRSLEFLYPAFSIVERAFVIDSTNTLRNLILEKDANQLIFHQNIIPEWINTYLLDKLPQGNV